MRNAFRASKNSKRQLRVQNHRIEFVAGGDISAAFEQFVLCIHRFDSSLGVFTNTFSITTTLLGWRTA